MLIDYLDTVKFWWCSVQLLSCVQLFVTPMDCNMAGFPVHHQQWELAQTHAHQVDDIIQPSHPSSLPSPPAFNHSQHQGLSFQYSLISSSILGTYQSGEFIFHCPIFLPFHTVHGVLKARILKWFAIPFSCGLHFVRTLHLDPSILGGSTQHGSWFHSISQGCGPCDQFD